MDRHTKYQLRGSIDQEGVKGIGTIVDRTVLTIQGSPRETVYLITEIDGNRSNVGVRTSQ